MKETYFVIRNSDGDTTITQYDGKEDLLSDIESGEFGKDGDGILCNLPANNDPNYWIEGAVLIIKGQIVVPKAEQVITKFRIE